MQLLVVAVIIGSQRRGSIVATRLISIRRHTMRKTLMDVFGMGKL